MCSHYLTVLLGYSMEAHSLNPTSSGTTTLRASHSDMSTKSSQVNTPPKGYTVGSYLSLGYWRRIGNRILHYSCEWDSWGQGEAGGRHGHHNRGCNGQVNHAKSHCNRRESWGGVPTRASTRSCNSRTPQLINKYATMSWAVKEVAASVTNSERAVEGRDF